MASASLVLALLALAAAPAVAETVYCVDQSGTVTDWDPCISIAEPVECAGDVTHPDIQGAADAIRTGGAGGLICVATPGVHTEQVTIDFDDPADGPLPTLHFVSADEPNFCPDPDPGLPAFVVRAPDARPPPTMSKKPATATTPTTPSTPTPPSCATASTTTATPSPTTAPPPCPPTALRCPVTSSSTTTPSPRTVSTGSIPTATATPPTPGRPGAT